jgi:predicted MFS family arabinose efflux permease
VVTAVASVCNAFRWPAFIAATTLLVPKKHLGRASGFVQMAQAVSQVLSPALAGVLLSFMGLNGILLMDVVSFLFSLASLWIVRFPHPHGEKKSGSLFQEAAEGWQYIARRRGLLMLLLYFTIINFLVAFISVLVTPLVMSTSSEVVLGTIMSAGGVGMLVGSFVMSVWGGPKRRVYGVLGFTLLSGVAIVCGGLRFSPLLFMVCAFAFFLSVPIVAGCSQAIWQAKVNPDLQGRVFALVRMAILSAMPVATALAGPLADHVFEPLMAVHGPLSDSIGRLIGTGPGRGIGLMFVLFGILTAATAVIGYLNPHLRRVELELPDAVSEGEQQAPVSSEQVSATP